MKRINRNCIVCGANTYKKIFNMTYDFVKDVLNSDPGPKYGWKKDTNTWIVECNNCKCTYVPEVIL